MAIFIVIECDKCYRTYESDTASDYLAWRQAEEAGWKKREVDSEMLEYCLKCCEEKNT